MCIEHIKQLYFRGQVENKKNKFHAVPQECCLAWGSIFFFLRILTQCLDFIVVDI